MSVCEPRRRLRSAPVVEQPGDRAVAEVEHEPRALVPVVEEVRLAARRDEQDGAELGLGGEERAREPQRDRRPHRDVVVLERERARAAEPVGDPRRRLPDRVVLPGRAVVEDGPDRGRVDVVLGEEPARRLDREVAHVLVLRGDVLPAQAELLDDHVLRDPARRADLGGGHPPLRQVVGRRRDPDAGSSTAVPGADRARDDAPELVEDVRRELVAARPEDPAHPDELADPHQRPREQLGIGLLDLPRLHRLRGGRRRSRSSGARSGAGASRARRTPPGG